MKLKHGLTFSIGMSVCLIAGSAVSAQQTGVYQTIGDPSVKYTSRYQDVPKAPGADVPAAPVADTIGAVGGDSGCDTGCDTEQGGFLKGLIKPSNHCFDDFISPMTNPVFFEDPRNLTELRLIFLNHKTPAAIGGGEARLYAAQMRLKISENASLIATKSGYIDSSTPLINDGWADSAFGLKFNLRRNTELGRMLSAGFTFELASGEADALQGNGSGELNLFMTAGRRIGECSHWISASGWRLPMDATDESQSVYWSNHWDRRIGSKFYAVTELNWYHWTRSGKGGINGVEGLDLINLGSTGVAGNDIVTGAVGGKFKKSRHSEIGVAYEFPLTSRQDILDNRLTVDWIFRY